MKRFMYLSIGMLALMLAAFAGFHMGSSSAQAQGGGIVSFEFGQFSYVMDTNGDVWMQVAFQGISQTCWGSDTNTWEFCSDPPLYVGNFWGGQPPVSTSKQTWGKTKQEYKRKN